MKLTLPVLLGSVAVAASALAGHPAQAAPQILGLVATATPAQLTCAHGVCSAEFTSFCLQQRRAIPTRGRQYSAAPETQLRLVVTDANGYQRSIPAADKVKIEARRAFVAVRISVPEDYITAMGGTSAAISVGPLASIVPVPRPEDTSPQTAAEIASFTGPLRQIATGTYDAHDTVAEMVERTNRMINVLPEWKTISADERRQTWHKAFGTPPGSAATPGAKLAHEAYADCRRELNRNLRDGMRACLTQYHDNAVIRLTKEVWKSFKTGS